MRDVAMRPAPVAQVEQGPQMAAGEGTGEPLRLGHPAEDSDAVVVDHTHSSPYDGKVGDLELLVMTSGCADDVGRHS